MCWKDSAVMTIRVPSDVPFFRYSNVANYLNVDKSESINEMNEGEILIAPFCSIDISESKYVYAGGGRYQNEHRATINRGQLQEISPEDEQAGMKYLIEHASECSDMLKDLLTYKFTKEEVDLRKRIYQLKMEKNEAARQSKNNVELIQSYEEEIKDCKKKIEESETQSQLAEKTVKKFKSIIRSICMSRCKAIEKAIDLDYETQKSEFIAKKIEENLQEKIQKKNDVGMRAKKVQQEHQQESKYLNSIIKQKSYIAEIAASMDIPYFEYFKNPNELLESNYEKEKGLKRLIESMALFSNQDIDLLSDEELSTVDILTESIEKSSVSYNNLSELFLHKQNKAFLFAIHNKLLWNKCIMHYNDLAMELKQIESRSVVDRIKDLFKGVGMAKKERAVQIINALPLIKKRREMLEQVQDYNEDILPEDVYAELIQMKEKIGEETFLKMYEFISENYSLNQKIINTRKQQIDQQEQLPTVTDRKKKMSEAEKMQYFLQANGYIQDEQQNYDSKRNRLSETHIDEVQQEAQRCIQANRRCVGYINSCDKVLRGEENKQPNERIDIIEQNNER